MITLRVSIQHLLDARVLHALGCQTVRDETSRVDHVLRGDNRPFRGDEDASVTRFPPSGDSGEMIMPPVQGEKIRQLEVSSTGPRKTFVKDECVDMFLGCDAMR